MCTKQRLFIAALVVAVLDSSRCDETEVPTCCYSNETLFLTPYINENKIEEARNLSCVKFFKTLARVEAYSGMITVNESTGSHYFFLHTKANKSAPLGTNGAEQMPLILWLFGGPGMSALFAQFLYNGPVTINANKSLTRRENALTNFAHVVYLDQPAGAGFSFTETEQGYSATMEQMSANIVEFLNQFLKMFPEHRNCDFYVAGESYGARNAMHLGHTLLGSNPTSLKFKGVINGAGYLGPVLKGLNPSDFLYQIGMLDVSGRKKFEETFRTIEALLSNQSTIEYGLYQLAQTVANNGQTLYTNLTGHVFDANALYSSVPKAILDYYDWVNSTTMKRWLHVGVNASIEKDIQLVSGRIAAGDFERDWSDAIENVLKNSRLLYYFAQFDTLFPVPNIDAYFRNLTWTKTHKFDEAPRNIVYNSSNREVDAYRTDFTNLTYVIVTRAGHQVSMERPGVVIPLIREFVTGANKESIKPTRD